MLLSGFVSIYFEMVLKSKTETFSVWDRNLLAVDQAVAHCYFDYKQVVRTEKVETTGSFFGGVKYTASKPRWVNLYGAPLGMQAWFFQKMTQRKQA